MYLTKSDSGRVWHIASMLNNKTVCGKDLTDWKAKELNLVDEKICVKCIKEFNREDLELQEHYRFVELSLELEKEFIKEINEGKKHPSERYISTEGKKIRGYSVSR